MKQYLDFARHILENGVGKTDRTGTGTLSVFGYQMRFDLAKGFPLLTTKKIHIKSVIHELLWILSGSTNVKDLQKHNVRIWDEWADENGELGPIYSKQWIAWGPNKINQISKVIESIKTNPDSRRHIVSAWNVDDIDKVRLPACHSYFQFYVANSKLSCQLYQRSGDCFLGIPFNIASYSFLTAMIAQITGLQLGEFIHTIGDAHIYKNHIEQIKLQLSREPKLLPTLTFARKVTDINDFKYEDFIINNYNSHPAIKAAVAV